MASLGNKHTYRDLITLHQTWGNHALNSNYA